MAWNKNADTERETFEEPQGDVVLEISDKKVVVVEQGEYKGEHYFNIRQFYRDREGNWGRGKGLSVPSDLAEDLFAGLTEWFENNEVVKAKKKKAVAKAEPTKASKKEVTPTRKTSASKLPPKTATKTVAKAKTPLKRSQRLADF